MCYNNNGMRAAFYLQLIVVIVFPKETLADWFYRCIKDGIVWAGNSRTYGSLNLKGAKCRFYNFGTRPPQFSENKASPEKRLEVKKTREKEKDFDQIIEKAATIYTIPKNLLRAVIMVESRFNKDAISSAGAQGLMQLMPATTEFLDVDDPFDPEQNILAGAKLLRWFSDKYNGDLNKILFAYYAGPLSVARNNGIPTEAAKRYIQKVMKMYEMYEAKSPK